ncbi:oxidoreductase, short-chain dehydrogenase/reductase family [gamma proteobacterium IMCC1989]|nr:oxidoreductase, short-chain dehydrogenase/reductase family [gamma proteobacterium IMCC1989]
MKKIVILGAMSTIAIACTRLWANKECEFILIARNKDKLSQIADDLTARGSIVHIKTSDFSDYSKHETLSKECFEKVGNIDILLTAYGTLPDQIECEKNTDIALQEFHTNGLSVISLLNHFAMRMEKQDTVSGTISGTIAVISSVAGDRGRASNYLYGAAKSAVSTYCSGLRARLSRTGIHVLTIKPGFVDTQMTQHLTLPEKLTASPEQVAHDISGAITSKKDVLYTRWFWRYIMLIIVIIPNRIFKKMKF